MIVDGVVPQAPLEEAELRGGIEFVIDQDKAMVELTALELAVTLGIIEDETAGGLMMSDTGKVVTL
jgi:hypothetical protein